MLKKGMGKMRSKRQAQDRLRGRSCDKVQEPKGSFRQLAGIAQLTSLNVGGSGVGDKDLSPVARLSHLEVLALQNTRITGAALVQLKGMQRLNVLNLKNCRVSDGDLEVLLSMPNLRIVHAAGSDISEAAVRTMNEKLPMLSIFR